MGQCLSGYLNRHRRKLFITGGIIGTVIFLNTYMRRRFLEWEKNRTLEYLNQIKKQNHFDGTLQTCDSALLSFMPKIREIILETIDVEPIVEELKKKPKNKVELWDELKIMVFVQLVAEMYAQCLLVALLRVQICVLGGYIYVNSQKNKGASESSENQQKYLSHISNFLTGGIKDLLIPVEDAVRKSLRGIKLSDSLKLSDFQDIFSNITREMSQNSSKVIPDITQYLMFPEHVDSNRNQNGNCKDAFLEEMVRETKDILECEDFEKVLSCSLEKGVAMLMDRISECYLHINSGNGDFMNPHIVSVPLAKIIPIVHSVFENHKPSEQGSLVYTLLQQENMKIFAANLYEAFSQEYT